MKKIMYLLMVFTISFTLFGCSNSEKSKTDASKNEPAIEEKVEKKEDSSNKKTTKEMANEPNKETTKKTTNKPNKVTTKKPTTETTKKPMTTADWKEKIPNVNRYFVNGKIHGESSDEDHYMVYIKDVTADEFERYYNDSRIAFPKVEGYIIDEKRCNASAWMFPSKGGYSLQLALYETVTYTADGEEQPLKHSDGTPILSVAIMVKVDSSDESL